VTDAPTAAPTVPGLTGLTVLARGGYATVYKAMQESVGRDVAVKVENRTLESERDRRRFLREARAAGRMSSHPHVVDLFDAGVTVDGHPYLIMELCDGSYAERMKTSPLSAAEARDVGMKIADALADAHALGVLHRDVKPANILMSRFGEPALADFGLAILAESRDSSITLDVLTPAYAPPEMFRYAPPSPAADVYALCATLYALMRGRPPRWRQDSMPSLVSLVDMFGEPIPDLPGVPPDMMALLRAGMANDEANRPGAAELRDSLLAVSVTPGSAPVSAPPPPPSVPTLPPGYPPGPSGDETTQRHAAPIASPPIGRRGPWVAGGAAALALVTVIGLLTWYGLTHRHHPGSPAAHGSASASPSASVKPSASTSAAPCVLTGTAPGIQCVGAAECYDGTTVPAGLKKVSCDQPHAWEVWALVPLPSGVTSGDYQTVASNPAVTRACSQFELLTLNVNVFDWRIDMLPPTPDAFKAGDRQVRCLAGPIGRKATGATFGH
jgi:serine/threonine protein kinase